MPLSTSSSSLASAPLVIIKHHYCHVRSSVYLGGGAFFWFGRKSSRDGSSDGDGGSGDGEGSTPKRFPGLSEEHIVHIYF